MESSQALPKEILDHIRPYEEDPEKAHLWDSSPFGGPGVLTTLLLRQWAVPLAKTSRHHCYISASKAGSWWSPQIVAECGTALMGSALPDARWGMFGLVTD